MEFRLLTHASMGWPNFPHYKRIGHIRHGLFMSDLRLRDTRARAVRNV